MKLENKLLKTIIEFSKPEDFIKAMEKKYKLLNKQNIELRNKNKKLNQDNLKLIEKVVTMKNYISEIK